MAQYIDKDALVSKIEKRIKSINSCPFRTAELGSEKSDEGQLNAYNVMLSFIDTLEVKEVDLEKEFSQWWKGERAKDYNVDILYERYPNVSMKLAKHFFELGLNAQKGE